MTIKKYYAFFLFMTASFATVAQRAGEIPLQTNDLIPSYTLKRLVNYPEKQANLQDFTGKLLILDFWNSRCAACLHSWPKLMSLQETFKSDMQIILVNPYETYAQVLPLLKKRAAILKQQMNLASVYGDSNLAKMFPHEGDPFIVWISKEGKIMAQTSGDKLNETNIKQFMESGTIELESRPTKSVPLNVSKLLFENNNGGDGANRLGQSTLSRYVAGLDNWAFVMKTDSVNDRYQLTVTNLPIRDLYRLAFSTFSLQISKKRSAQERIPLNRVHFNVKNAARYGADGNEDTVNLYVYQTFLQSGSRKQLLESMQYDLAKYFRLKAEWKKVRKPCLVFSCPDSAGVTRPIDNRDFYLDEKFFSISETNMMFRNARMQNIIELLTFASNYSNSPYPIIDETGLERPIGLIDVETDIYNYKQLDKALSAYGLRLTLQDREMEVLEISEPENYSFPY